MNFKLAFLKKKKQEKPLQAPNRFFLENKFFLRLIGNLLILTLLFFVCIVRVTMHEHLLEERLNSLKTEFYKYSASRGLNIEDVLIEGRQKTSVKDLEEAISLNRNNSILQVDLKQIKDQIEKLPWVEKAEVKRLFFPNVVQVYLKEKDIIALYQTEGHFYPIDNKGRLIKTEFVPEKEYLIVVGEGAPEKLFDLFDITKTVPEMHQRIKAVVLHGNRRWDLIFDDLEHGMTIKMPEQNLDRAWKKLIKINNQYGIFKRKLTFIDLRYQDKVIVNVAD